MQAAQSGLDIAMGQLRSGAGDIEKLPPCAMTGTSPLGTGGAVTTYSVKIDYYVLGKANQEPELVTGCNVLSAPVYAELTAVGSAPNGSITNAVKQLVTRTLQATYTFQTNNENISGGAIPLAGAPLCMDSGKDQYPAAGTTAQVQTCKLGGSSDQRFAYTTDLNIKVVGSETSSAPNGMCLEAGYPRANDNPVLFQPCAGLVPRQQWSLNDSSLFSGTREDQVKLNEFCLNVRTAATAGDIVLGSCSSSATKNIFRPEAGVGAGMSGAKTGQLVNFKQFSRCLDVTNFKPDWPYMIVWFCKQAPDGTVPWNQHWNIPEQATSDAEAELKAGLMWTSSSSSAQRYCLRSPGVPDQYVTMIACDTTVTPTDQTLIWKIYGKTDNYASAFRIMDKFGYCLTPTDLTAVPKDTHTDGTAKVKVVTCSRSELQKWNAPANLNQPLALTGTREKITN